MKLKTKFLLFFALIYITLISVTVSIYQNNKILFLACEILIALSLIFFFHFYKIFFKPFDLLQAGIDSIADKDFGLKFLPIGQPEFDGLIDVYNKMIDQLRLERIKASEKHFFLEKLIDASPAGIIILDINHNIKVINKVGMQILNINTNEYPTAIKALQDPWGAELSKLENNSTILIQMNGINRYKCHKSYFLDRGVKRTFYYIEDLAKEILQVESQAYEKVIRMMSHEVNNSVGSVNSILDSSIQFLGAINHEKMRDYIEALNVAKGRMSSLNIFTKRFADVVRIPPPDKRNCDLREILNRVLQSYQTDLAEKNITVSVDMVSHVSIFFDIQQLELVLVNIVKNAIQAIFSNGKINIRFKKSPLSLIFENDGEPIPPANQRKLFEPFFTTKKTGQGIGLTLIREILVNHECEFNLHTRQDGITEFKIIFKNIV